MGEKESGGGESGGERREREGERRESEGERRERRTECEKTGEEGRGRGRGRPAPPLPPLPSTLRFDPGKIVRGLRKKRKSQTVIL